MKKGVIVASFGTTHEDTRKKTIDVIENDIKNTYKDSIILRAWTSDIIRAKLKKRHDVHINDISTHIMDGIENNKVKEVAASYKDKFSRIRMGNALLESDEDFEYLIKELDSLYEKEDGAAYLLMGHGSDHESNKIYELLRNRFAECGRDDIYIACVEGYPYLEDVLPHLSGYKTVHLSPFMIVAGDHAKNDMAGDEDSFKSILEEMDKNVDYELKGLGEYDFVRRLILKHADEANYVS